MSGRIQADTKVGNGNVWLGLGLGLAPPIGVFLGPRRLKFGIYTN